jgi:Tfp pilus assembly protein PilF
MARQKPGDAVKCFERSLALDDKDVLSAVNLGIALHTAGRLNDAVNAYKRAIKMDPENPEVYLDLGVALNEQRRTDEATAAIQEAIRLDPNLDRAYADLAALYEDTNCIDEAWDAVQKGLALKPDNPRMILEAGKLLRRRGEIDEAAKMLKRINLDDVDHRLAQYIHYELGLCLDRGSDPDKAFDHFTLANQYAQKNERLQSVDPGRFLTKIDDLQKFFDQTSAAQWKKGQSEPVENAPVFLYGFPRSGTTLIDVILNAHPSIETLEEKPTIFRVEHYLRSRDDGYPASLANLTSDDLELLRGMYFKVVDEHVDRKPGTVVVDKMPIRTVHAGLIERLFPGSRVLFSVRHPCDVCLSAYMQQFNTSDAFSNFFTLEDTVAIYDKVMTLWRRYVDVLSIDARMIRYEDLVDDFEPSVRRLLSLAGVAWDPGVVDFTDHAKSRGRIATNSYHQVTEPLYQRAKYRWHRYRKHFVPFMDTLRPHIVYLGYEE